MKLREGKIYIHIVVATVLLLLGGFMITVAHSPAPRVEPVQMEIIDPFLSEISTLMLSDEDVYGRELELDKRVLLLYGGTCSECSLKQIDFDLIPVDEFDETVILYSAKIADIKKALPKHEKIKFVSELKPEIVGELSPQWTGRWYVFESGKLVDFQKDGGEQP